MTYQTSEITRNNPSAFLFIIDQSSSMAQPFGARTEGTPPQTKAEGVATALNNLLRNLIITCSKSDGIRDYFAVGLIGYGETIGPAWAGALWGQEMVPIRQVANSYARLVERTTTVDDGTGTLVEQVTRAPVWVEPTAKGSTLMCGALEYGYRVMQAWLMRNASCFPPVIVHITDGEATDGDPAPYLSALTELGSTNGRVLLFNVHLSSNREAEPVSFPDSVEGLPRRDGKTDPFARLLFERASRLTPYMRSVAWEHGLLLTESAKAFVLNADPSMMVMALEIGTRPGNLW